MCAGKVNKWRKTDLKQLFIGNTEESTGSFRDMMPDDLFGFEGRLSQIYLLFLPLKDVPPSRYVYRFMHVCIHIYTERGRKKKCTYLLIVTTSACQNLFYSLFFATLHMIYVSYHKYKIYFDYLLLAF